MSMTRSSASARQQLMRRLLTRWWPWLVLLCLTMILGGGWWALFVVLRDSKDMPTQVLPILNASLTVAVIGLFLVIEPRSRARFRGLGGVLLLALILAALFSYVLAGVASSGGD